MPDSSWENSSALSLSHVHSDQSLDVALERMGANHLDVLPVESRECASTEGIVTLQSVLESYGIGPA